MQPSQHYPVSCPYCRLSRLHHPKQSLPLVIASWRVAAEVAVEPLQVREAVAAFRQGQEGLIGGCAKR